MTRVLVCWEDRYFRKLDQCLRRVLRKLDLNDLRALEMTPFGVQGNGGFFPFVKADWPIASRNGFLRSSGPIDYLVCIADADKASECCDIEPPPKTPEPTDEWLLRANQAFTKKLRAETTINPHQVSGHFLRWSLESLLIAAFDVEAALRKLGCRDVPGVESHLGTKKPSPRGPWSRAIRQSLSKTSRLPRRNAESRRR